MRSKVGSGFPDTPPPGSILVVLRNELLVSVATFLGVKELGRLSQVSKRFTNKRVMQLKETRLVAVTTAAAEAGEPDDEQVVTIAEAAAATLLDGMAPTEGDMRDAQHLARAVGATVWSNAGLRVTQSRPTIQAETCLRVLWALRERAAWGRYSPKFYGVEEHLPLALSNVPRSVSLTAKVWATNWRMALGTVGGAPMVVGPGAGVHYVEVELWNLGERGEQECGAIYVGVGRPDLDAEKDINHCSPGFWGLETSTGTFHHGGASTQWKGMQIFRDGSRWEMDPDDGYLGDKIGLLLDGEAGTLTIYHTTFGQPIKRLGMVAGAPAGTAGELCLPRLTGELCWAVGMVEGPRGSRPGHPDQLDENGEILDEDRDRRGDTGQSVRLTAKPPPLGWREDESIAPTPRNVAAWGEAPPDDY